MCCVEFFHGPSHRMAFPGMDGAERLASVGEGMCHV
jgi:hypothetical protein